MRAVVVAFVRAAIHTLGALCFCIKRRRTYLHAVIVENTDVGTLQRLGG